MKKVLVIGGYGFFGAIITRRLAADPSLRVIIAGRDADKCRVLAAELQQSPNLPLYHAMDVHTELASVLDHLKPDIVIHTSGPFQGQSYAVAQTCIDHGCHYIDLADGRDFVAGIGQLDTQARAKNLLVVSGASSVPALSSAIIDYYRPKFARLRSVDYGITVAQRADLGLATARAVLSYAGKPISMLKNGQMTDVTGARDLHLHNYPELGLRLFAACDIPDHALLPQWYPELETLRFGAAQELMGLQLGVWLLTWLVKIKLIPDLASCARVLIALRRRFNIFGGDNSGLHMILTGDGHDGAPRREAFYMIAKSGHGVHIPTIPAVLLAQGLASGVVTARGAMPCMGLLSLPQYLKGLAGLEVTVMEEPHA